MADIHETGKKGEELAAAFLAEKGYSILETNWQSNHQEIDIIAKHHDILVIIEVKTRKSVFYGEPELFVTRNKQRMIIKAANHYLFKYKLNLEVRFDIVTVIFQGDEPVINHIENAYYPCI
jgi:putative endonuclease